MPNYQFAFSQCLRHAFMSGAGYVDITYIEVEFPE